MKKVFKVVVGAGLVIFAAVAVANAVDEFIRRKKSADEARAIEAEDEACREVIYKLKHLNKLSSDALKYVESDTVPIFAYDSKLNIEQLRIPKRYTLLKLIQPSGVATYALGKMFEEENYHILAYFVDDWDDDL